MNTYKITLSTVADITVTVEAEDEDDALDVAYATARDFANQTHAGNHYTVDIT